MRFTIEVKDDKIPYMMEFFRNHKFLKVETVKSDNGHSLKTKSKVKKSNIIPVKRKPVNTEKEKILKSIKQAVDELNLYKKGKIKLRDARDLLNEL